MGKIVIVTDSLCDIPQSIVKAWDLDVIPLGVIFKGDNKVYKDGVDVTPKMIFDRVNAGEELPTTSAIPPAEYIEAFKRHIDKGEQVIYLGIGSGISSSYNNAVMAASMVDEKNIRCIDSRNLSTGIALLLHKTRLYIDQGKSIDEIVELIKAHALKNSVKFCIDRMDYLYKGGRCSGTKYLIGKMLHIHPVIKVTENKLIVYKKPRGPYVKALDEQIDEFIDDYTNGRIEDDLVFITHTCSEEDGDYQYVFEKISKYIPKEKIAITTAGATVSTHCGPRTLGILYLLK